MGLNVVENHITNIQCIGWLTWCVVEAETEVAQSRPSPYGWQLFPGFYAVTVVKELPHKS